MFFPTLREHKDILIFPDVQERSTIHHGIQDLYQDVNNTGWESLKSSLDFLSANRR